MKKLIFTALLATMALSANAQLSTHAQDYDYFDNSDFKVDGICYKVVDGDAYVTFGPYDILSCIESSVMVVRPNGYEGDVEIPATVSYDGVEYNVTGIDKMAFYQCENLTSVIIPPSVESIGEMAFFECWNIKELNIPESVQSIGTYAFSGCNKLEAFYGPNTTEDHRLIVLNGKAIGFASCGLTDYVIPDIVTAIGSFVFDSDVLESVVIPESVEEIERNAFEYCSVRHVKLPDNLRTLNSGTFWVCRRLESIELPENIEDIRFACFWDCSSLTNVKWSKSLKNIDGSAFSGCISLEEVILPESLSSIGSYAFADCDNLKTLVIPDSEITIGSQTFENCRALEAIKILASFPTKLKVEADAFDGVDYEKCVLYVPYGTANAYKTTIPWRNFKLVEEIPGASVQDINDDSKSDADLYTLDGKRVDTPQRGLIYIKEGKKIIFQAD